MPSRTPISLFNAAIATVALLLGAQISFGQALNSSTASVTLNATLGETLTVAATPSTVNFALVSGGTALGSVPVAITTTWVLAVGRANVILDAYFGTPTAALTFAGPPVANIPTSAVLGEDLLGSPTTYTAFTQTNALGSAGTGLQIFSVPLTALNRAAVRVDSLLLEIDTSGLVLPAATYTGTMTLQAQAL
jgi:hypothetical protein